MWQGQYRKEVREKVIVFKDILSKLKEAGYSTTRLRNEKILSESTLTKIRQNKSITLETLDVVCKLTGLPISELIEYKAD